VCDALWDFVEEPCTGACVRFPWVVEGIANDNDVRLLEAEGEDVDDGDGVDTGRITSSPSMEAWLGSSLFSIASSEKLVGAGTSVV